MAAKRLFTIALICLSSLAHASGWPCWHLLLEAQDRSLIATDQLADRRVALKRAEEILAGYLSLEQGGAIPGKTIILARFEVQRAQLSIGVAESQLREATIEQEIWQQRTAGSSEDEVKPLFVQLWNARAERLLAEVAVAEAELDYETKNYERLAALTNGAIPEKDARQALFS